MSIQPFSFPVPETRFFQAGQDVYKFKIRRGDRSSTGEKDMLDGALISEELESAVRAVLANLDGLYPFATQHFNIFPYKSKWERVSKLRFLKGGVKLSAYPFLITLYVEFREPICPHTGTNTNVWIPLEYIARSPLCTGDKLRKVQTTVMECPEEGAMSQDNQNKIATENSQYFQVHSSCI
ncbi:membrane-anchored junction protein [Myxocyprinus asiaticus]|uniref:membrane-anchored junction protein n=1 Tax=Myxocyprinus asiaticus TaxID=70543 RepID=UPI002222A7C5|nr:membrane-anchored junction protein [Myxocyprinus asiaticus]